MDNPDLQEFSEALQKAVKNRTAVFEANLIDAFDAAMKDARIAALNSIKKDFAEAVNPNPDVIEKNAKNVLRDVFDKGYKPRFNNIKTMYVDDINNIFIKAIIRPDGSGPTVQNVKAILAILSESAKRSADTPAM